MDVRVFVETVFENGDVLTHEVGHICRPLGDADPETLGLQLEETKGLLKRLQKAVLRDHRIWLPFAPGPVLSNGSISDCSSCICSGTSKPSSARRGGRGNLDRLLSCGN
jgi:hypothetical protein